MLVVGIIGILATLGVGFSGTYIKDQRLKASARAVQSAISMARAEAVRSSSAATFSVANNTIYAYKDINKNKVYDAGDTLIYRYPAANAAPLPATTSIYVTGLVTSAGISPIGSFNYEGLYFDGSGTLSGATICIKDSTLNDVRAVQMTVTGACRSLGMAAGAAACP
ncbi:hypothetical protein Q3G72_001726 [Acer saccharum]|nr:hypothetical protein Q3G72_001726 [Acer saccharum]